MSFNKVVLMGNVTADPDLRYLPSQAEVVNFALALNHKWKDRSGVMQEDVSFIDCVAWGATASLIGKYFTKGKPMMIEGRLRQSRWQDREGKNRSKVEVVVEKVCFLPGGGTSGPRFSNQYNGQREQPQRQQQKAHQYVGRNDSQAYEDTPKSEERAPTYEYPQDDYEPPIGEEIPF